MSENLTKYLPTYYDEGEYEDDYLDELLGEDRYVPPKCNISWEHRMGYNSQGSFCRIPESDRWMQITSKKAVRYFDVYGDEEVVGHGTSFIVSGDTRHWVRIVSDRLPCISGRTIRRLPDGIYFKLQHYDRFEPDRIERLRNDSSSNRKHRKESGKNRSY